MFATVFRYPLQRRPARNVQALVALRPCVAHTPRLHAPCMLTHAAAEWSMLRCLET